MPADIEIAYLKSFTPFDKLADAHLSDIIKKGEFMYVPKGTMVFKRGATDEYDYWLIDGTLDLLDAEFRVTPLSSNDADSHAPIDNESPHRFTVVCTSQSTLFRLTKSYLDLITKLDEAGNYMVTNVDEVHEEQSDWMSSLLSAPLFDFVQPAQIQKLFSKFEPVVRYQGDTIILQGEPGDYFFVIQSGRVKVEQETDGLPVKVAEMGPGSFFGEDALVSDVARNATVTMVSDGKLMRLSQPDFESLLHRPLIEKLSRVEAEKLLQQDEPAAYYLDVRSTEEYEVDKIEGGINLPLMSLRKNLERLKQDAVYVACCNGDKRAELAAYILNENGFTAYVLREDDQG